MRLKTILFLSLTAFLISGVSGQNSDHATLAGSLRQHVSILAADSLEGRGLGTEGKLMAKRYISSYFRKIGLEAYDSVGYYQHFIVRSGIMQANASNVIGFIRGTDSYLQNEFIIIGAHYDHLGYAVADGNYTIYNGADDNASGVAAMLELARILTVNEEKPKRSIIFIGFDAEESGLLGAKEFLNRNTLASTEKIKAMFSLDMVGMYKSNGGIDLYGMKTFVNGAEIAENAALAHNISIKRMTSEIAQNTDTQPFGEAGIPAIHAYTGQKSPYHKPTDTWEKLDYEGMAATTLFMADLILEMAETDELIPFRSLDRSKPYIGFNAGAIVMLGSSKHMYPDDFFNAKRITSFGAGLAFQLHLGSKVTVQAESSFYSLGSKSPSGILRRYSLYSPVNIHWNLVSMGRENRFSVYGGVYHRYSFSGTDGKEELNFTDVYNNREWGVNFGVAIDIMKWQIKSEWQRGISGLMMDDNTKIIPAGWHFCIAKWF